MQPMQLWRPMLIHWRGLFCATDQHLQHCRPTRWLADGDRRPGEHSSRPANRWWPAQWRVVQRMRNRSPCDLSAMPHADERNGNFNYISIIFHLHHAPWIFSPRVVVSKSSACYGGTNSSVSSSFDSKSVLLFAFFTSPRHANVTDTHTHKKLHALTNDPRTARTIIQRKCNDMSGSTVPTPSHDWHRTQWNRGRERQPYTMSNNF